MIQRQQRVLAECDDNRLFLDAQHCQMHDDGTGGQVLDRRAPLPLGDCRLVDPVALGQNPQALLTMLYRSTDCLCRSGAPV